jgi:hypothetical protein
MMNLPLITKRAALPLFLALSTLAPAQSRPMPVQIKPPALAPEPTTPPAVTFHDSRYGVTFHLPPAWNLTRRDSDISTFNLDARTAPRNAQMRAAADISFNPLPYSTFSGAFFYFSVTPHTTETQCHFQASAKPPRTVSTSLIGGVPFSHGYDEHGNICTEERDEVYVTQRNGACYRFDLVINTFCGEDVSGVKSITDQELATIRKRLENILSTVQFDAPSPRAMN